MKGVGGMSSLLVVRVWVVGWLRVVREGRFELGEDVNLTFFF